MHRLTAGNSARVDRKPVVRHANAAREALPEDFAPHPYMAKSGALGFRARHRWGRLEVDSRRTRLGHERLAVEKQHCAVVAADGERPLERRRQP